MLNKNRRFASISYTILILGIISIIFSGILSVKECVKAESHEAISVSSSGQLIIPEDWHFNTRRDKFGLPRVLWPYLSHLSSNNDLLIEPVFAGERVLSGYTIYPNAEIEIFEDRKFTTDGLPAYFYTLSDDTGYFEVYLNDMQRTSTIDVLVHGQTGKSFIEGIKPLKARPTPLEHESGYLTVDRLFWDDAVATGYTYPNATITAIYYSGYATNMQTFYADANGYFEVDVQQQFDPTRHTFTGIQVTHPETGEEITVIPYPWTQYELENARW